MKKKPIPQTAELFVGAYLGAIRSKSGIPLEQAAKDTRIRTQRLREIESDDFSGFVHPTYVRLFLLDYANYLGVPIDEIRPMLPDRTGMAAGGFDYLNVLATPDNRKPKTEPKRPQQRLLVFLSALAVTLLALVIGLYFLLTWRKLERVVLSVPIPAVAPEQPQAAPPTPGGGGAAAEPSSEVAMSDVVVLEISSPYEPAVTEPARTDPASPWPAVAAFPLVSPSPTPEATPTPAPSPSRKPPRRHPR